MAYGKRTGSHKLVLYITMDLRNEQYDYREESRFLIRWGDYALPTLGNQKALRIEELQREVLTRTTINIMSMLRREYE
ncbi:hypothetical protein AAHB53_08240 [Niallia circulans]